MIYIAPISRIESEALNTLYHLADTLYHLAEPQHVI